MDNKSSQLEEIEALSSIFEKEWSYNICSNNYSIKIADNVILYITMTPGYPSNDPPKYELSAPYLKKEQKNYIYEEFHKIYTDSQGFPIIYQWITRLQDIICDINVPETPSIIMSDQLSSQCRLNDIDKCEDVPDLQITHGPLITDRKSTFQGHVCELKDKQHIKQMLNTLHENKKIAHALHNVLAYRLTIDNGVVLQDCDDDHESQAGSRLLHLLNVLDVKNVAVVVTRWYGGIHLGPARFRHYNNAARQALLDGGFIKL